MPEPLDAGLDLLDIGLRLAHIVLGQELDDAHKFSTKNKDPDPEAFDFTVSDGCGKSAHSRSVV